MARTKKMKFPDFLKQIEMIGKYKAELRKLGIHFCDIGSAYFDWERCNSIAEKVHRENPFGIDLKGKVEISLAVEQERMNRSLDNEEIDFINDFFDYDITRDDISKIHSKYI